MKILAWIILAISFISCTNSKLTCSRFYTYNTKKIDIKGISTKLKKQGIEIGDFTIAEISIDPKFVIASDELQRLDMLQYYLCAQIKGLPKKDSLRKTTVTEYINTLIDMIKIAQKPDSSLSSKISKLEEAELARSAEEKKNMLLKNTPPKVDADMKFDINGHLGLSINFLNDVPIVIDFYLTKYQSDTGIGPIFFEKHEIHPTLKDKIFNINYDDLNYWELSKTTISKFTMHFLFESIYFKESRNLALKFKIMKSYELDPLNQTIKAIEKQIIKYSN